MSETFGIACDSYKLKLSDIRNRLKVECSEIELFECQNELQSKFKQLICTYEDLRSCTHVDIGCIAIPTAPVRSEMVNEYASRKFRLHLKIAIPSLARVQAAHSKREHTRGTIVAESQGRVIEINS